MTSPLSSLNKGKRPVFHRPPPFRPVVDIESVISADLEQCSVSDDIPSDCTQLVDETTTSMLKSKRTHNMRTPWKSTSTTSNNSEKEPHAPTDMDLMSTMMGRISQLQLRVQFHEKELADKNKQIELLKQQLKNVTNAQKSSSHSNEKIEYLERENKKLRKQTYDMEEFLADYGMMWAGNSDSDSELEELAPVNLTASTMWQPMKSVPEFIVNYDSIIANIRDLNVLAGEGESKIHHTAGGAELKRPDPVNLSLYANGILMFDGPFRPFSDPETRTCVQDLMDGYFPTELQKRFPDGVLFSVHDHRHLHYKQKKSRAFEGQGQVLGGETKPSRLVPSNLDKAINTTMSSHVKPLSSEKFLAQLPSNIVKKGKVIDIRKAVSDLIQGEKLPESISVVNTAVVDDIRKSARGERVPEPDEGSCTTLRIKHGDMTYLLVMKCSETVGDIRKHLSEHSSTLNGVLYDFVTSYPRKIYSDDKLTLEEAGLVPNAMLHLQIRK